MTDGVRTDLEEATIEGHLGLQVTGKHPAVGRQVILLVAGALLCCAEPRAPQAGTDLLPQQVHGLQLSESRSGERAAGFIGRLHGKSVAPLESHVGLYGRGGMQAVLYVSRFASRQEALTQADAMVARIAAGVPGYGHYSHFSVAATVVYSTFAQGQVHYFFAKDIDLTWLAATPKLARPAIAELLNVSIDSIPALGSSPGG
ncbi:MAG: hypothetical protein JSV86_20120 [Gemmatimonadota bacterium]|nr:MAG: hypothetical protein JSV86_20120 [Gemmatimonadota bacterium]